MTVTGWLIPVVTTRFGLVSPSVLSILTIMAEAHQRDDQGRQQEQQACVVLPNVTVLTVYNFCLKKNVLLFSVKREMPILVLVNCESTVSFSVKRGLAPFTTLPKGWRAVNGQIISKALYSFLLSYYRLDFLVPLSQSISYIYIFNYSFDKKRLSIFEQPSRIQLVQNYDYLTRRNPCFIGRLAQIIIFLPFRYLLSVS